MLAKSRIAQFVCITCLTIEFSFLATREAAGAPLAGDLNGDDRVSLADYRVFVRCMTEPLRTADAGVNCGCADLAPGTTTNGPMPDLHDFQAFTELLGTHSTVELCQPEIDGRFKTRTVGGRVNALTVFDDGLGPALYAAGQAGGILTQWTGQRWEAVPNPGIASDSCGMYADLPCEGSALVFDDGSGPALFVSGPFTDYGNGVRSSGIAKWDGRSWHSLGGGLHFDVARCMVPFDDGNGPSLYVGARANLGGGYVTSASIARWNGRKWSSLRGSEWSRVDVMAVYDDGTGPALYAGGDWLGTGDFTVAKWYGTAWALVETFAPTSVESMLAFDDGSGPALYIAGRLRRADGFDSKGVTRWNGTTWTAVGPSDLDAPIHAKSLIIQPAVDGDATTGPALLALTDSPTNIAFTVSRWDGKTWTKVGPTLWGSTTTFAGFHESPAGWTMYIAGSAFNPTGPGGFDELGRWDGKQWTELQGGDGQGIPGKVSKLVVFEDDMGSHFYAAGSFQTAGGIEARNIARWDGTQWLPAAAGTNRQISKAVACAVGGQSALFVAGSFSQAGAVEARRFARWDGSEWSAPSNEIGVTESSKMACWDDGAGDDLYAASYLLRPGDSDWNDTHVMRWDGQEWSQVGPALPARILALSASSDPRLRRLCVVVWLAGSAPSTHVPSVMCWNGADWSALGTLPWDETLFVAGTQIAFPDLGNGPEILASSVGEEYNGYFGGAVRRWDGANWTLVAQGLNIPPSYIGAHDIGHGPQLVTLDRPLYGNGSFNRGPAHWDGCSWRDFDGVSSATCVVSVQESDGDAIYFGSALSKGGITRWFRPNKPCK